MEKNIKRQIKFILFPVFSCFMAFLSFNATANTATLSGEKGDKVLNRILQIKEKLDNPISIEMQKKLQQKEIRKKQILLINKNVKTIKRSIIVSTSTDSKIPIIKVAPGFATSLIFLDIKGNSYPIQDYIIGGSKFFNVVKSKSEHILMISPKAFAAKTNLQIILKGKNSPISIILSVSDLSEERAFVDDVVKVTIPNRGPNSSIPNINKILGNKVGESDIDGSMMMFLDKTPPKVAKKVLIKTNLRNQILWEYKGEYYIRTKYNLFFPAYREMVTSENGYKVYKTGKVLFFKLYLNDGNIGQIEVLDE